ncbi:MAG: alpha amylase C-terminal domain-containing protein, partial [Propionibacteriaceae bacterium]|nr:alpha amylase C-terminal domain-containing protein [Propionibacteriaceae bacterium]
NVFAWLRSDGQNRLVACITNFSATPHDRYRLGLPQAGTWKEILNTNATQYDGTGDYANGTVTAVQVEHRGFPAHCEIKIPALSTIWLEWVPQHIEPPHKAAKRTKIK